MPVKEPMSEQRPRTVRPIGRMSGVIPLLVELPETRKWRASSLFPAFMFVVSFAYAKALTADAYPSALLVSFVASIVIVLNWNMLREPLHCALNVASGIAGLIIASVPGAATVALPVMIAAVFAGGIVSAWNRPVLLRRAVIDMCIAGALMAFVVVSDATAAALAAAVILTLPSLLPDRSARSRRPA